MFFTMIICDDAIFLQWTPSFRVNTDLKNTDLHFSNISKAAGFCSKTLHDHIYENCKISRFLRLFPYFRSETRILKE